MKLYLFRNHIGILSGDPGSKISVNAPYEGILRIGDKTFPCGKNGASVKLTEDGVHYLTFTTKDGVKFHCGSVRVSGGKVRPCNVPEPYVLDLMARVDALENRCEELTDQIQKIKAEVIYDSIGFLTEEKK